MVSILTVVGGMYAASVVTTLLAVAWAYLSGRGRARRWFLAAGAAVTLWTLAGASQLLVGGTASIRAFQATWILRWVAVLAWLGFVLVYTGREPTRPAIAAPAVGVFLITVVTLATSHRHEFVFSGLSVATQPVTHVTFTREIGFLVLSVPAFVIIGYVFVALTRVALATRRESRTQAAALAVGILAPAVIGIAQTANALPYPWVRYAAVGNCIQMIGVAYGVFGGGLFQFDPITRGTVIEAIEDPMIVVDDDWLVADYNAAAERLFPDLAGGRRLGAVAGPLVAEASGERRADGERRAGDQSAGSDPTDGGHRVADRIEPTVDGETRTLVVTTTPVDRGRVIVCRDVTSVEQYANELERQTEQLDRFASVVSHDLRNPLTVAEGYLEMAQTETDDPATVDQLARVADAHDRMGQLIDDTLTLARQGSVVDETQPVEVAGLAKDSWVFVETDGQLETGPAKDHRIEADPDRLQSAFENLFRNAVEHAGPDAQVTVGPTPDGFYVADDGPGIPPEDRETVFDEGFSTDDDGTGFGLAIVRSVATAHGADVSVTDSDAGGARFEFTGFSVPAADNDPFGVGPSARDRPATTDFDGEADRNESDADDTGRESSGGRTDTPSAAGGNTDDDRRSTRTATTDETEDDTSAGGRERSAAGTDDEADARPGPHPGE